MEEDMEVSVPRPEGLIQLEMPQVADEERCRDAAVQMLRALFDKTSGENKLMKNFNKSTADYFQDQFIKSTTMENTIALLFSQIAKLTKTVNNLIEKNEALTVQLKNNEVNITPNQTGSHKKRKRNNKKKRSKNQKKYQEKQTEWKTVNVDPEHREEIWKKNLCNN